LQRSSSDPYVAEGAMRLRAQEHPSRFGVSPVELKTAKKLAEMLHREEVIWRQRSHVHRLSEGDKNTRKNN
jgi:hypothetical protein